MERWIPERCRGCRGGHLCTEKLSLFRELPEKMQASLTAQAIPSNHARSSSLFQMGDPIDRIRIICRGQVKLCRFDPDGKEYVVDVLSEGNSIWEGLFAKNSHFLYDGVCLTDVEICEIPKEIFMKAVMKEPDVTMYLIGLLSERLAEAKEKAALLAVRNPHVRMAGFLLDRDRRWSGTEIHLKLEEIAASVGLRPETVSRTLRGFEKQGIIRRNGQGRITILDRDGLRKIAVEGGIPASADEN